MKISFVVYSMHITKRLLKRLGMLLKIINIMLLNTLSVIDKFAAFSLAHFANSRFVARMKFVINAPYAMALKTDHKPQENSIFNAKKLNSYCSSQIRKFNFLIYPSALCYRS